MQLILNVFALMLGATYLIGGLIVNLHLSRYGITQYQVLRVKYLVVGLTYLTNFIAILFLAAIPAIFTVTLSLLFQQIILIASLLASIWLLWLWGKPSNSKSFFFSWRFWIAIGTVSLIFPLMVGIRLGLIVGHGVPLNYDILLAVVEGFLAVVLAFVGQTYYYARHLYGKSNTVFGSVDPIGTGIPVQVQLAGERDKISLLSNIGVPMLNPETTDKIVLIDETSTHYIIGITSQSGLRAVEVAKDIVKAIRYI